MIQRAFVISLSSDWKPGDPLAGRVEHVTSGKTGRFHNLDELSAFADLTIRELMAAGETQPPDHSQNPTAELPKH